MMRFKEFKTVCALGNNFYVIDMKPMMIKYLYWNNYI